MSNRKSFTSDEFIEETYARKLGSSFQNKPWELFGQTENNRVLGSEGPGEFIINSPE